MRTKLLNIFIIAAVALSMAACNRPKVIPDGELTDIFKEIFIANAYVSTNYRIRMDSMDMYSPILKKHGYDVDDLVYTMGNFSKRKSMKLSDVVNNAITALEKGESYFNERLAVLDTVNVRAQRMLKRTVYQDSLITARKIADTAKLRIKLPVEYGTYEVDYFYFIDSLDSNKNIKTTFTFRDSTGTGTGTITNWMTATKRQSYITKLNAKKNDEILEILFGNYPAKGMKTPGIEIDSLRIVYYPPVETAVDSVSKLLLGYHIQETRYDKITQDSSALRVRPPRLPENGDDND